jgi:translation elongation factor EF-1beta
MIDKLSICNQLMPWDCELDIKDEFDWAEYVGYQLFESEEVQHMDAVAKALDKVAEVEKQALEAFVKSYMERVQTLQSVLKFAPALNAVDISKCPDDVKQFLVAYYDWLSVVKPILNSKG